MTDKELIKALRCCTSRPDCDKCAEECVFYLGNNVEGCVPDMGVTVSNRLEALLADNEQLREATKMVGKDTNVPTSAEDSPTVDAVEVVFCKDCKHQEDCIGRIELMGRNLVLELNTYECHPLKFCSYGERRCE